MCASYEYASAYFMCRITDRIICFVAMFGSQVKRFLVVWNGAMGDCLEHAPDSPALQAAIPRFDFFPKKSQLNLSHQNAVRWAAWLNSRTVFREDSKVSAARAALVAVHLQLEVSIARAPFARCRGCYCAGACCRRGLRWGFLTLGLGRSAGPHAS